MSRVFNFSSIKNHPNDIESFELDATELIDSIYVGPQGDLLEKLEHFNHRYDAKLGITKQFTFKPGAYDQIKKAYANWVLRWDMKPRGIESIFKRIRDYGWRYSGIKQELLDLESKMLRLRSSGLRWQDNTDDFHIELDKLKSIIINALEVCRQLYPNIEIGAKILPTVPPPRRDRRGYYGGRTFFPEITDADDMNYILVFHLRIKKPIMKVHVLRSDESTDRYEFESEDILCCTGIHLLPLVSRIWGKDELDTGLINSNLIPWHCEAAYLSPMSLNQHPYIQSCSDAYVIELEEDQPIQSHVCFGNMEREIKSSLMNMQIEAHLTYLVTWLTNYYIPQTQPLNRIKKMRQHGRNVQFEKYSHTVTNFIQETVPNSCRLSDQIHGSIFKYARRARQNSYYGAVGYSVDINTDEYFQRMQQYLDHIKEEDLPCNECEFNLDCDQATNIRLFLSREELDPMEEAYLGMFIEIHHVTAQSRTNREDNLRRNYTYVEEYLYYAFRTNIDEEYERFLLACKVADHAILGLEHRNFNCERYLTIARILFNKHINSLRLLLRRSNDLLTWDYNDFREFNETNEITAAELDAQIEESDMEDFVARMHEDEGLTPEERTLRWASAAGGATNL